MKFDVNKSALKAKLDKAWKDSLAPLSQQVLKDCNFYARQDQGTLISSSQTASDFEDGKLVWDTPYAKKVYYTGEPSHDVNQNASLMWCEKAKAEKGETWKAQANRLFNGGG